MNETSFAICDLLLRAANISEHIEYLLNRLQERLVQFDPTVSHEIQNLDLATQLSVELTALLKRLSLDPHVRGAGEVEDLDAILSPVKLDCVSSILSGEVISRQTHCSEVELF
ncbi:MAG: hypothetical protein ABF876_18530 [Acetobacter aceti]|uniref:Uncharacterized protein n=1 Tax=Acetobacter aceti TaxID=435 RepID=A0A1U9KE84_ACEAC|nr:hypothetical protein [Acetobacter aceti]AQS84124.1 hypothetical protein A0U92_04345 [Acetobacter aceti]